MPLVFCMHQILSISEAFLDQHFVCGLNLMASIHRVIYVLINSFPKYFHQAPSHNRIEAKPF